MSINYSPELVTDGAVFVGDARESSTATAGSRLYNQANVDSANVKLLIHGNEGSGQSFTDSSLSNHTITANGNVTHSTTQSKFSGGSIYFDGSGDYLQLADSADWSNGANDFTWDCWIHPTTSMNRHAGIIHQGETAASQECNTLNTYNDGTGNIRWLIRNASGTLLDIKTASSSLKTNEWYHVAAVRNGSYFTIYINGIAAVTSSAITTAIADLSWPMFIGKRDQNSGGTSYWYEGYIDEVRITKGAALWTQNFTPPARRDTLSISDGMMYNGSCISLDGGDEYVNCGDASDLTVTTGSFTLIGYIRNNTIGGYDVVVQKGNAGHGTNPGYRLRWENDNTLDFICTQSSSYAEATLQSLGALSQDVWYQVAVTRNAGLLSVYIDGVLNNSLASAITGTLTTSENFIIGRNNYGSGSGYFDGQMADWKFFNVALSADQVKELYDNSKLIIPSGVSQTNLKLWLPLSEGAGTVCYDGSGNGNHGTFVNADSSGDWLTGQTGPPQLIEGYNRPMQFDNDGYLSGGPTLVATNDYTFSWWCRSTQTAENANLFTSGGTAVGGFHLNWSTTNNALFYLNGNNYTYWSAGAAQDDGEWHHWLITYYGTASSDRQARDSSLFIDGVLIGHGSYTDSAAPSAWSDFRISTNSGSPGTFEGSINEFIIYEGMLGSAERAQLYATDVNGGPLPPDPMSFSNSSDIVAYWRNDDATTWKNRGPQVIKNFTNVATDPINDSNAIGDWTHNGTSLTSVPGGRWGASGTPNGGRPPRYRFFFNSAINCTVNSIRPVTSGKSYKISAWFKGGTSTTARLIVTGGYYDSGNFTASATAWTNKTATFRATATGNVTIELHNRAAGTMYFDDVTFVESGPALDLTVNGSPDVTLIKQGINGSASTSAGRDNQGFPLLGKNNGAVGFNGSDNYIVIDGVAPLMGSVTDFTISCWAKCVDNGANQILVAVNGAALGTVTLMRVSCDNADKYFDVYDGGGVDIAGTTNVADGNWHYFTYVRVGTGTDEAHIYVDGVLQNSGTHVTALSSDDLWSIGQEWDAGPAASQFFNGQIANVQVYSRALSVAEITQNYNAQRSRFE